MRIASVFSGVGTPELALKALGIEFKTVFAAEIDKYARQTYLANNEEPETFYEDVTKIDGNKYKGLIDIFVGGSPCQAFSIAGKQGGFEDTRGTLFFEYARLVKESQPKVFIYENVKGLISHDKPKGGVEIDGTLYKKDYPSIFNKEYDGKKKGLGKTFHIVENTFKELGYHIFWDIVNTKDYGIPQNRERIYAVGFRDGAFSNALFDIEVPDFKFATKQELKLRLKDMLEDSVNSKYLLKQELVKKYKETGTASNYQGSQAGQVVDTDKKDIFHTINAGSHGYSMGYVKLKQSHILDIKGNESIKRIYSEDGLCPALTTMGGGHREPKVAIYKEDDYIFRKLTPRECFRLQGFDDSFVFPEKMSDTQLYKQAGNGMSRNVLEMIFMQVFKTLGDKI